MAPAYGSGRGGRFSDSLLDDIRARTDIVAVIGEYVQLKKRGSNFLGLCPFHQEKTPSFTVSPDKQMFYCFGCQTGGNVFSFLMKREGLAFAEAVEQLAGRAGIPVPDPAALRAGPQAQAALQKRKQETELLYKVLDLSSRYFHQALLKSAEAAKARAYLERRGIRPESVEAFRIGYSLDSWNALHKFLTGKGYTDALLERAGLALRGRDTGAVSPDATSATPSAPGGSVARAPSYYDRFRGRLMFTITDQRGRPIGFGARALREGDEPKYLNSPETPVFSKGRGLYALHLATQSIRRNGKALVVEGYMDVIACHEFGFDFAVASMGTAFTSDQARALHRLTDTVVTAFDADSAGTQATIRGLEILTAAGFKVKVAEIPGGKDPDDCLRGEGGPEAFRQAVDEAVSLAEYRFRLACRRNDTTTIEGRVAAVNEILPVLTGIQSAVELDEYIHDFAQRLPVAEDSLRQEFGRYLKAASDPRRRGVRASIEQWRGARQGSSSAVEEVAGAAGPAAPKRVLDAERALIAYMVAGEETLHPTIGELLEVAEWCRQVGVPLEATTETAEEAAASEAAAAGDEDFPDELTGTETSLLRWFLAPAHRRLVRLVLQLARDGPIDPAQLVDFVSENAATAAPESESAIDNEAARIASRVVFEAQSLADEPERAIRDCVNVLKEHRLNSRIEELHRRISDLERSGVVVARDFPELIREQITLLGLAQRSAGGITQWKDPGA